MYAGDFLKRVRKLNPAMRVCSFGDNNHLAGLYHIDKQGEYQDICGVDKNWLPEYSEWDDQGHMLVSGWRRVYLILLKLNLTTREKIQSVCPGFFLHWTQNAVDEDRRIRIAGDKIQEKIQKYSADKDIMSADEFLDVANDINKKDSQAEQEQAEKDRWFLKTWANRGGNESDKPNY